MTALPGIPLIQPGDDLTTLLLESLQRADIALRDGDVLVITSKIVSKAEGRLVVLADITPGAEAYHVAAEAHKDPRIVELVLRESIKISRLSPNVLVTQHRLGFVSANAGIDQSNIENGDDHVLLLPLNPDASAQQIRARVARQAGVNIGVVISDSHGRPFRMGNVGVAIGAAGIPALLDLRGQPDLYGRKLKISMQGYADLIASAAHLLSGEGGEGRPAMHLRGLEYPPGEGNAADLNRPIEQDLYR